MNDYTGIVSSLRECCGEGVCDCTKCIMTPQKDDDYTWCVDELMLKAADAIERLYQITQEWEETKSRAAEMIEPFISNISIPTKEDQ